MKEKQYLSFADWVEDNKDEILQAQEFTKDAISGTPGQLADQVSRAQAEFARMGGLLADAESYLTQAEAAATLEIRQAYSDITGPERKALVRDRVRDIRKLRDILEVTVTALKQKTFVLMNSRNYLSAERRTCS